MDRLALLAGTLASAVRLRSADRASTWDEAASVAGTALDLADPEVREATRQLLTHHGLLGPGDEQFPANPWVLWDERIAEPVFTLLRSVRVDEEEARRRLQETPMSVLLTWTTPTVVLAALGLPHRRLVVPRWVGPTIMVGLLAVGVGALVKWRD